MLKKFFSTFVLSSLFLGVVLAQSYEAAPEEKSQIPFIPSLGGNVMTPEETLQFVEVKSPMVFEEPGNNPNDKIVSAPVKTVQTASIQKRYQPYVYGMRHFSMQNDVARLQDLEEAFGKAPRSFYSDNQRSSRINALYGRIARERYYPSLRTERMEVAGVYEYNARLLTNKVQ